MTVQDRIDDILAISPSIKSVWYGRLADCVQEGNILPPVPAANPARDAYIAYVCVQDSPIAPLEDFLVMSPFLSSSAEKSLEFLHHHLVTTQYVGDKRKARQDESLTG